MSTLPPPALPLPALPLTPAQRRLWALGQLRPADPFFSIPFAITVEGPLDVDALRQALDALVRRHDALRVRIERDADGEPVQRIGAPAPIALDPVDVTREEAAARADAFVRTPFDLDGGPLLRAELLRLSPLSHQLLVGVHHIVFDGASLELFTTELVALYEAFATGRTEPLPRPAVGYGEFLAARTAQDEEAAPERLAYWTQRLAGAPALLELPLAGPRRARAGHTGARVTTVVPEPVVEPLRRLARTKRASLFMVLKAAVDVVLSQYGGTDVLTGMAVSGRDTTESAGVIGYLTRPVVLRGELADDPEFTDLIGRVRGDLLDALDHPDLLVDEVMDRLGIARDPSYHPLYQVMYTHAPAAPLHEAAGSRFGAAELRLPTMKTDLAIDTVEGEHGLLALADYRTDLFDEATVGLLLDRLRLVLERIGADPKARVSALLRTEAPAPGAAYEDGAPGTLHELVAEQIARTPDAVAVAAGTRTWTYRELDRAADRVAARLGALGVGPETPVGVCAPKSFALAAAQLGVVRAGGICVPLDPELPAFLLRLAVDDAGLRTVLADAYSGALFDHTRVDVLDAQDAADDASGTAPRAVRVTARGAAWVLRTAGVTGEPRAVVAEHRNLVSRLRWAHRELPASALDAVAQLAAPDSPAAFLELFGPLTRGGRAVVPTGGDEATVLAAPAELAGLLTGGARIPVLSTGEPLFPGTLAAALAAGATDVHQLYGCAETAGPVLAGPARTPQGEDHGPLPLGPPATATAYVLDARGAIAATGAIGELHIGGPAVTRGYLDRGGRTAERFLPDPFGGEPGARLFATGDLARRLPDGRFVFAGRAADHALVRGVRVAALDVEAALLAHRGVARAQVLIDPADGSLAAAVATRPGADLTVDVLRTHLRDLLPGHLLPARLHLAGRLPLLPGGRPDREAIAKLIAEAAAAEAAQPADGADAHPATDTERTVAAAWEQVLGRTVGASENFFDVGGNSLLLIRLRDRLRGALDREVDVVDLFRHSTVKAMAAFLGGVPAPDAPSAAGERGQSRAQARAEAMRARGDARRTSTPIPRKR
ncbi:non-ribosomal peptide synthetase component F [Streptomyces sp. CG 926]|uniref:condensation domain-containing protein n=1 Tax=Streptomyces sp. CG 926 TaxID=1882405 RepID=UPI000D6AE3F0|nr:condensation domain-containing protein [Streptomyces sp. CG 926]PWK71875.1 non-ribosomal peptide synthetase component F [Streptomyces sp. CG 926]